MKSHINSRFRKAYRELPTEIRKQARQAYKHFATNPNHPSLHFKKVHTKEPIYSARISSGYRVLGIFVEVDVIVWFWIGSHTDYNKLLSQL